MATAASSPDRSDVTQSLRRLGQAVHAAELNETQLAHLVAGIDAISLQVDDERTSIRGPWWKRGPDYRAAFAADSPFRGRENPWGPVMRIEHHGAVGEGVGAGAIGHVTLDQRWAGPPQAAHGGMLAGLIDEIVGEAASHAQPEVFSVTGRLAIRYRQTTPLNVPLQLKADVTSASRLSLKVTATCTANEEITATAQALMVVRRRRRQTERL